MACFIIYYLYYHGYDGKHERQAYDGNIERVARENADTRGKTAERCGGNHKLNDALTHFVVFRKSCDERKNNLHRAKVEGQVGFFNEHAVLVHPLSLNENAKNLDDFTYNCASAKHRERGRE